MAHSSSGTPSIKAFTNTNLAIVLDDTGTNYRVRLFSTQGDISTVPPTSTTIFSDAEVANGKLLAYLRLIVPGLV